MNYKCKQCGIKKPTDTEIITHGIKRFCSKKCRISFVASEKKQEKEKEQKKRKNARETVSMLTKKADRIFSEYIRRKYSDKNGIITCISCEKKLHWKDSHNCHWISRGNRQYRYDEDNCRPGCVGCNTYNQQFHMRIFTQKQIKRLGQEAVDLMEDNCKYVYKQGKIELREIIKDYTEKLSQIKN